MSYYIGIDPGKSGGIAILDELNNPVIAMLMPDSLEEIIQTLSPYIPDSIISLEDVHSMPGQGVTSMFTFGTGYGELRGVIKTLHYFSPYKEFLLVTPQKWKTKILGKTEKIKDESPSDRKKRLKQKSIETAMSMYPLVDLYPEKKKKSTVPSDGIAEALLIASYSYMHGHP